MMLRESNLEVSPQIISDHMQSIRALDYLLFFTRPLEQCQTVGINYYVQPNLNIYS